MKDDISYFFFLTAKRIPLFGESTGNISIEKQTVWMQRSTQRVNKTDWFLLPGL